MRVGIHGINFIRRPRLLRTPHLLPRVPGPTGAVVAMFSAMLWLTAAMVVAMVYMLVILMQVSAWALRHGAPWASGQLARRRAANRTRSAAPRPTPLADARHQQVLERDGFHCHWCGGPNDLVISRAYPAGTDEPGNLQTLCRPCADYKGNTVMDNPWLPPHQPWSTPAP